MWLDPNNGHGYINRVWLHMVTVSLLPLMTITIAVQGYSSTDDWSIWWYNWKWWNCNSWRMSHASIQYYWCKKAQALCQRYNGQLSNVYGCWIWNHKIYSGLHILFAGNQPRYPDEIAVWDWWLFWGKTCEIFCLIYSWTKLMCLLLWIGSHTLWSSARD